MAVNKKTLENRVFWGSFDIPLLKEKTDMPKNHLPTIKKLFCHFSLCLSKETKQKKRHSSYVSPNRSRAFCTGGPA